MDYEKKYNEAIERAKQFMSEHPTRAEADLMVALFPELRESEDERTRKEIIEFIRSQIEDGNSVGWDRWIAYLEKQKELPFVKDVMLGYPGLYFYDGERMHFRGNPAMEENPYDFAMSQQEEKQKEQPIELCDGACCDDDRFKIIAEAKKDIVEKTNITENELSMELPLLDGILMRVWQVGWLNKKPAELQKEQKPVEYLDKDKVYAIMNKLTELSTSDLIPIESEEYVKIHEITSDVCSLLNYPIEQKSAEWIEEDD